MYPHVYSKLSFGPFMDFTAVSLASKRVHGRAVGPTVPASLTDVRGILAWAKANTDKASHGAPSAGATRISSARCRGSPTWSAADAAINQASNDRSLADGLAPIGLVPRSSTVEEMAHSQRAEFDRRGLRVERVGFAAER